MHIYIYTIYVCIWYMYLYKLVYTNYLYLKRNPPDSPDCSSTSSVRATLLPPTWAHRFRCLSCGTIDVPASLACWRSSCSKRLWKLLACATSAIARATVRRLFGTTQTHDRESERTGDKKKSGPTYLPLRQWGCLPDLEIHVACCFHCPLATVSWGVSMLSWQF